MYLECIYLKATKYARLCLESVTQTCVSMLSYYNQTVIGV